MMILDKYNIRQIKKDLPYYLMLLLPISFYIIFRYIPMYGISLSFRKFVPGGAAYGVEWVGLKYFKFFIADPSFWNVFKNTLVLSGLSLLIGFPLPIIFALLLNEIPSVGKKKLIQTISYLPRFLSMVIVVGMMNQLLSPNGGIINKLIELVGREKIFFLIRPEWFRTIYISSEVWQYLGWNAILYIAALSNIDLQLYDAAKIDGANRLKQTIHITIPGIMPTIIIMLILQIGNVLSIGFEKVLLLYNPITYQTADVISTYVYRLGIIQNNYSYATAIGFFNGIIALILISSANSISRRISETSLW